MKKNFAFFSVLLVLLLSVVLCASSCVKNPGDDDTGSVTATATDSPQTSEEPENAATTEEIEPSRGAETSREWTDFY